ncbi:MAG: hypothetical protein DCC49_02750 [Acidobacteria bacterium]|nr:MAG: hypothetical protein DCC49_02750 [Acidobacteriota bacterium]
MSEMPTVQPNPRIDLKVNAADGNATREMRQTTYSGRLHFGDTSQGPRSTMVSEFNGLIPLPDSFSYRSEETGEAVVTIDLWTVNTRGYTFTSGYEATFVEDSRRPGTAWLHIGMQIACDAGSVVGYRIVALAGIGAIASG